MSTPSPSSPATPPPSKPDRPAPPSAASRYLFVFLVGLLIGVIGLVMVLRALEARKTNLDKWPNATMVLLSVHSGKLRDSVNENRCSATDLLPHLQTMRALGNDFEPAFPDLADDARYKDHARNMRAALDAALASPPINCAGAGAALAQVGDGCKACHQDFRN